MNEMLHGHQAWQATGGECFPLELSSRVMDARPGIFDTQENRAAECCLHLIAGNVRIAALPGMGSDWYLPVCAHGLNVARRAIRSGEVVDE